MEPLISKLNISMFRGIRELELDHLSRINVLIGANNSGKTSILEAIRLMSQPYNIGTLMQVAFLRTPFTMRKIKSVEYFSTIFVKETENDGKFHYSLAFDMVIDNILYKYEAGGDVRELTDSTGESDKIFSLTIKIIQEDKKPVYIIHNIKNRSNESFESSSEPLFHGTYLHSGVSYYRSCVKLLSVSIINEQKKEILDIIASFDPNVEDISIVGEDIYLHNAVSGTLPLFSYGAGLQKAVLLTALLAGNQNGILLIDEIDNAINISAFQEIFSWFINACRCFNIQAFVTTHSAEAIDAILENCCIETKDDIRIITLRKELNEHRTRAIVRTGKEAIRDRSEFEMELRV